MDVIEVPAAHKNLISGDILFKNASVIGLGHLGSDLAVNISKLGLPEMYLYDHDQVEERNISGTPFTSSTIGLPKVEAMREILVDGSSQKRLLLPIKAKVEKAGDLVEQTDFYFVTTDSISSRLTIFESICEQIDDDRFRYLIDIRTRVPMAEIYGVPLNNPAVKIWYKENLRSKLNDPTPEVHCNEANIIQNTKFATAVATQLFSNVLDGLTRHAFFRLDISKYQVIHVDIPLAEYQEEYDKQHKKRACGLCGTKHRSESTRTKCRQKHLKDEEKKADQQLPSREQLFG